MKILVILEQREGVLKSSGLEALTLANQLTSDKSNISALLIGDVLSSAVEELKNHNLSTAYVCEDPNLKNYNVLSYSKIAYQLINTLNSDLILSCSSPIGRDLMPRLGAMCNVEPITDVTSVQVAGEGLVLTKPLFAGKVLQKINVKPEKKQMISIRPNTVGVKLSAEKTNISVEKLSPPSADGRLQMIELRESEKKQIDLTEAQIIISGGRSLGSAENFKILESCAAVVGAGVGASRAAVDAGFASHSMQVGQTGKTVNPKLYIACGISGAIQHLAGMRTSKVIVAINKDEQAPIFSIADYGIVADLFEAVPVMEQKFKDLNL